MRDRLVSSCALALAAAVFWLLAGGRSAHAQVTTLAQQAAVLEPLLAQAKADPGSVAANARSFLPQYGFYCGYQTPPPGAAPIDCLDLACLEHDLSPGYSLPNPALSQVVQADRAFIADLFTVRASTPYGELYRNVAIEVFETKTTIERANRISLVTPCSDCEPFP